MHWVNTTSDAPPLIDLNHDLLPDQVDRTLDAFETAWRVEVARMGFRAPMSDGSSSDHGPNDLLDVYLADVGASGLAGYTATDDPHANDDAYPYRNYSAYIVVDDDFSTAQLGSTGGLGGLRATAAHEFFHAVQYAYDSSEDPWLTEGTAVWMEDEVADDVDANRRWLRSSALEHPWVPVDSSRGMNEYGAWIFWRFLTESAGGHGDDSTLIRRVWELAADGPGDPNLFSAQALQQVLGSYHRSLAGALATFGAWNLAPAAFYQEGAAYPHAPISGHASHQRRTTCDRLVDGVAEPSDDRHGLVRASRYRRRIVAAVPRWTAERDGCGRTDRDLPAVGRHPVGAGDARRPGRRRHHRSVLIGTGEPGRPHRREREH